VAFPSQPSLADTNIGGVSLASGLPSGGQSTMSQAGLGLNLGQPFLPIQSPTDTITNVNKIPNTFSTNDASTINKNLVERFGVL